MGFLKRIFSIGSKKNKKRPHIVHNVDARLRVIEEEEHEAVVGRLLRSSSARYAVTSEVDYTSLPPLPHPINQVIQTPASSTVSIASSTISQKGTYTVTVHKRKRHALTEFPNANRALDSDTVTPQQYPSDHTHNKDNSQLLRLRSDPSVASLLEMYDEHGRISSTAFSNSPPNHEEGRAQTRRTGSTLRQLLGNPSSLNSKTNAEMGSFEGDISWAERFLGEGGSVSSASSLDLPTPNTPNTRFIHDSSQSNNVHNDLSLSTDHDFYSNACENPAISSMEVELSTAESLPPIDDPLKLYNPYRNSDPTTPQRASQVFDFLTEKRRSKCINDSDICPPELPSVFSGSSHDGSPRAHEGRSHFSSEDSFDSNYSTSIQPAIPKPCLKSTSTSIIGINHTQHTSSELAASPSGIHQFGCEANPDHTDISQQPNGSQNDVEHQENSWGTPNLQEVKVIMTVPTKVIVTAPTPSSKLGPPNRIPQGPRVQSRRLSPGSTKKRRPASSWQSNSNSSHSHDLYTPIIPRHRPHHRTSSHGSSGSLSHPTKITLPMRLGHRRRGSETHSILNDLNKENEVELSVKYKLPSTPLRSKSNSRSLLRAAVSPEMFKPPAGMTPSPASSSELSPLGRQLMINVRQQRSKAREVDRERRSGRLGLAGVRYQA